MHQSQLIKLLKTLTPNEFKQFSKFVRSPYFNTNTHLIRFYDILKKYYPDFNSSRLEKEQLHEKLFPTKVYSDIVMRKLISLMKQLVERLILDLGVQRNQFATDFLLIEEYGRRNLYPLYEKEIQRMIAQLEADPIRDLTYFLKLCLLHRMLHFHPDTFRNTSKTIHIREADKYLNYFFALTKLHFGSEMMNREKLLPEQHNIPLLDEILIRMQEEWIHELPLLNLYGKVIKLLKTERDDDLFLVIKQDFLTQINTISKADRALILVILLNYSTTVYYDGDGLLLKEQFDLYQIGLDYELLIFNQRITNQTFLNIVIIGSILKKFSKLTDFIEEYAPFIKEKIRTEILLISQSYIAFHQKQYFTTEQLLHSFQPKDTGLLIRSRFLLIMSQYEILNKNPSYFETLLYQLEAFIKFIQRNKNLSDSMKKPILNFVRFTTKLAHLKTTFEKEKFKTIEIQLKQSNELVAKYWLRSKLQELEQGRRG